MHEMSLMTDLIRKVEGTAQAQQASKVVCVTVKLGALSHISPDHLREHFAQATRGTLAEGARLQVEILTDLADPQAQQIVLDSVEVEV
jgi:hydrogenase nickel incorporation protein HypA/HybF